MFCDHIYLAQFQKISNLQSALRSTSTKLLLLNSIMDRPLAPASYPHSRNLSSFHFPDSLRRKNIGNACLACKGRKSKCDRGSPCKNCEKHGTKCVFDATSDFRREIAVKRKLDDMNRDHYLLDKLLRTLKDGDNGQVLRVLGVVRSRAPLEEISSYLDGNSTANTSLNESALSEVRRALERVGSSEYPEASPPPRHDP